MLKHHIKTILRNIVRHRSSSIINVVGLAMGIACCLLISLWIIGEYTFDDFQGNIQNTYEVFTVGGSGDNPATPAPLAAALAGQFPEVESAIRYEPFSTTLIGYKEKRFYEDDIVATDPGFFEIFSFPLLRGDPATALENTYSVVLTQSVARKYFGEEDPLGKALTINQSRLFTVTGVIDDVPVNSSLQFDLLIPFEYRVQLAKELTGWDMNWGWYSPSTYVKLAANSVPGELETKMSPFFGERTGDADDALSLMSFKDYHFYSTGTKSYVFIFAAIALLIIVMAGINFVNLATARSARRAREIGVRKVAGASRGNLYALLLGESVATAVIAFMIAVALVDLVSPILRSITGMSLTVTMFSLPQFLPAAFVFAVIVGTLAGVYPAVYLSSLRPVGAFKGGLKAGEGGLTLRRLLVVAQIVCSVLLIVGTTVIFRQFNYLTSKDTGYEKEYVINVPLMGECRDLYPTLRQEMLRDEAVAEVGGSAAQFPYWRWTTGLVSWDGKDPDAEIQVCMNHIDVGLVEAMNIEVVEGRSFSDEFQSDVEANFLVNEEMVRMLGLQSGIGANLSYADTPGKIVGVMKDFHFEPLTGRIRPLVLALVPGNISNLVIRLRAGDIASSLASVEEVWQRVAPDFPFDYFFVGDAFDRRYSQIRRLGNISGSLAMIAVFIACLGLFGLASFVAQQRTKEVGIRKVLGASVASVVGLLSREHLILAVIASVVAWPMAYWAMSSWLENFAYHVELRAHDFILAGVLALLVVLISVSSQALRAATSSPVDSLRSE